MVAFAVDISHHQAGISIPQIKAEGISALIARVGQAAGTRRDGHTYADTRDREWAHHRDAARAVGLPLVGYWYIGNGRTPDANAAMCRDWMGDPTIPLMLDHEDASGSISFYRASLLAFEAAGLNVVLGYVPRWYWSAVGGGDLSGPPLVNSAYPGGTGTPAQIWGTGARFAQYYAGYGGGVPALHQFTNQASVAGYRVDCSAFRGTHDELMALIEGDDMPTADEIAAAVWRYQAPHPHIVDPATGLGKLVVVKDALLLGNDAAQRAEIAVNEGFGNLEAHEAELLAAVRAINVGGADATQIATALAPILAPLINGGISEDEITAAVRAVFADAGSATE